MRKILIYGPMMLFLLIALCGFVFQEELLAALGVFGALFTIFKNAK